MPDAETRVPSHLLITAKLACVNCRVKKIRCDMTRPVCGNCVRHAHSHNLSPEAVNCEYIPISSPSSMTPPNHGSRRKSNSPPARGKKSKSSKSSQDDEDDKRIDDLTKRLAFLENVVSNAMAVASANSNQQSMFRPSTSMSEHSSPLSGSPTSPWDASLATSNNSHSEPLVYPYPNSSHQFIPNAHVGGFGGQPSLTTSHGQENNMSHPVTTFASSNATTTIAYPDHGQNLDWSWLSSQPSNHGNLSHEDLEMLSKYYSNSV